MAKNKDFLDLGPPPISAPDPRERQMGGGGRRSGGGGEEGGGKRKAVIIGVLLGVAIAAGAGWFILNGMGNGGEGEGVPVVEPAPGPAKVPPSEPGGMDIPNQDRGVYGQLEQGGQPAPPALPPTLPPAQENNVAELPPPQTVPLPSVPPSPPGPRPPSPPPVPSVAPPTPPAAPGMPPAPAEVAPPAEPPPAPAKPAEPAPKPAPQTAQASIGGQYLVQILAARDSAKAEQEWTKIAKAHADILSAMAHTVVRADLGDKGIFYRLRMGPFADRGAADRMCATLKERNVGCLVVRNK